MRPDLPDPLSDSPNVAAARSRTLRFGLSFSLSTIREALPTRGLPTAAVGAVRGGGGRSTHAHRHRRKGKSPKTRYEFLSVSASGSWQHARETKALVGRPESSLGLRQRNRICGAEQSRKMPPSEWIGCRSGSGGRVVMRYSSFNSAACAASLYRCSSPLPLTPSTLLQG